MRYILEPILLCAKWSFSGEDTKVNKPNAYIIIEHQVVRMVYREINEI